MKEWFYLKSITGCIWILFGGNSDLIFGGFGTTGDFGIPSTVDACAVVGGSVAFGRGISNPSASHSAKSLCKAKLAEKIIKK